MNMIQGMFQRVKKGILSPTNKQGPPYHRYLQLSAFDPPKWALVPKRLFWKFLKKEISQKWS